MAGLEPLPLSHSKTMAAVALPPAVDTVPALRGIEDDVTTRTVHGVIVRDRITAYIPICARNHVGRRMAHSSIIGPILTVILAGDWSGRELAR